MAEAYNMNNEVMNITQRNDIEKTILSGSSFYKTFVNKIFTEIQNANEAKKKELAKQDIERFRSSTVAGLIEFNKKPRKYEATSPRPMTIIEAIAIKKQMGIKIAIDIEVDINDHKRLKDCDGARKRIALAEFIRINKNISDFTLNESDCKNEIMYFIEYSFFAWMATLNDFIEWRGKNRPIRPDYLEKLEYYQVVSDLINEARK